MNKDQIAERAFNLLAGQPKPPVTLECHHCHRQESFERMARTDQIAGESKTTRHFCHNGDRSCYSERRGHYFD